MWLKRNKRIKKESKKEVKEMKENGSYVKSLIYPKYIY